MKYASSLSVISIFYTNAGCFECRIVHYRDDCFSDIEFICIYFFFKMLQNMTSYTDSNLDIWFPYLLYIFTLSCGRVMTQKVIFPNITFFFLIMKLIYSSILNSASWALNLMSSGLNQFTQILLIWVVTFLF